MYFLILGLVGHHTPFCSFGLKVLSKIIEGEKILPYVARGREHLICEKLKDKKKETHTMSYVVTRLKGEKVRGTLGKCGTQRTLLLP